MSIMGILVTLIAGGFRTAQLRGRDAQRKADLKEIANSLELLYSDYGLYPTDSGGRMLGCPYDPILGTGTVCVFGSSEFTDSKTTYFKTLPADPGSLDYLYRLPGSNNQKFQLFARLENPKDKDCLGGDCNNPPVTHICGSKVCNFAVTSSNASPLE